MVTSAQYQNLSRRVIHQLTAHARLSARMIAVALQDLNGLDPDEAASARAWLENDDEGGASFTTCCAGIVNVQRYLAAMSHTGPSSLAIGKMHLDARQAQDPESFKTGIRTLAATSDISPLAGRWRHQAAEQLDICIDDQCSTIHSLSSHHDERALTFDQHREYGIEALGSSPGLNM